MNETKMEVKPETKTETKIPDPDKFPLYEELRALNVDMTNYSKDALVSAIQSMSARSDCKESLLIVQLIILRYSALKPTKVWGEKQTTIPYQGKTQGRGIIYQMSQLPDELCHIIYKYLKTIVVNF